MKKIFLCLVVTILPLSSFAESVNCISDDGKWEVKLELTADKASNIEFIRNGQTYAKFSDAEVNSYKFPKRIMNYEVALTSVKYLNIYRDMNGKIPGNTGSADFYLANHPFSLEKGAENCTFED